MKDEGVLSELDLEKKELISSILNEVFDALKERGYNPTRQVVGYLLSGDPGYISNYKGSRNRILEVERAELLTALLEDYIENKWDV